MFRKIGEVFTKKYRQDTECREFMKIMVDKFRLNDKSEDVHEKIKRLLNDNFVSKFKISLGDY